MNKIMGTQFAKQCTKCGALDYNSPMIWVRRGVVFILSLILFGSLVGLVGSINVNRNLGSSEQVKTILADSGFYDQVVAIALDEAQEQRESAGPTSIPLSDVIVQQAAKQAFTPQLIQSNAEQLIDANYKWLSGDVAKPSFTIDLSNTKETFANRVGQYIQERLSTLSSCTDAQLAQIQQPINPLAIPCLPPGVTPQSAAEQAVNELLTSNFIDTPVITANNLGRDANSTAQPYYEQIADAPKAFQLAKKMPFIHAGIILIAIVGIVFLSRPRRKGISRLAIVFLFAGFILITTALFMNVAVEAVAKQLDNGVSTQLEKPKDTALEHIAIQFTRINFWSGIVYVGIASALFGYLLRSRGKSGGELTANYQEPAQPGSTVQPAAPAPTAKPQTPPPPALKKRSSSGMPSQPAKPRPSTNASSRPMTATPAPKKRPPSPRGPRLIQ